METGRLLADAVGGNSSLDLLYQAGFQSERVRQRIQENPLGRRRRINHQHRGGIDFRCMLRRINVACQRRDIQRSPAFLEQKGLVVGGQVETVDLVENGLTLLGVDMSIRLRGPHNPARQEQAERNGAGTVLLRRQESAAGRGQRHGSGRLRTLLT